MGLEEDEEAEVEDPREHPIVLLCYAFGGWMDVRAHFWGSRGGPLRCKSLARCTLLVPCNPASFCCGSLERRPLLVTPVRNAPPPRPAALGPCGFGEQCNKDPETHTVKSEPGAPLPCIPRVGCPGNQALR